MTDASDPIGRSIFQRQVCGIANEMSTSLRQASFSSIIWDMRDYACGLLLPDTEMIAQADTIPAQLGVMPVALREMFHAIPVEEWAPGDIVICNDPYRGCAHTMDVCLFSPVFHGDRLMAITSTIAHHVDIGGRLPGSTVADNPEVFGEGLIFPPLKLFERGKPNRTAFDIMAANVRLPDASNGDMRAQIAGCRMGERRTLELIERYGADRFASLARDCLDYAETYMREAFRETGDGSATVTTFVEDDVTGTDLIRLEATVAIAGDRLEVDLTGSSDQRPFALNCPRASTMSMANYAAKAVFAPEIAQNGGCVRPIDVRTRRGSVLDPERPAAVGSRHHMQQAVADLVLRALAELAPERAAAGAHVSDPMITVSGLDDRAEQRRGSNRASYYVVADGLGGGMGASADADGLDAVDTHSGNCALISGEVIETVSPLRVLRTTLTPGSGGDGKHRGGLGMLRDYELLSENAVLTGILQRCRAETAPWGLHGGKPGGTAACIINPDTDREEKLPSKILQRRLNKGDVVRIIGGGGGGWGDPAERDPALAQRDREDGYTA